jgi:hypothetical protein
LACHCFCKIKKPNKNFLKLKCPPKNIANTSTTIRKVLVCKIFLLSNVRKYVKPKPISRQNKKMTQQYFPFGEEKLVAPLIAIPNVDRANRRQEKGKKLN